MIRFVEHAGVRYRVLKQESEGNWLISYDDPRAPFLADTATMEDYQRIETPEDFLAYWNKSEFSSAEKERFSLIQPLLDDEKCISDKRCRLIMAKECASSGGCTVRRVLRVYYRRLATGILVEKKERKARSEPNFDWAIRTFYFSSKRFSLKAAYEMMLVQRYTSEEGVFVDDLPRWSSFQHYYYRRGYHKHPQKIISREGLSNYQRNHRPMYGSSAAWRGTVGTYQMDATEADIYLVSRFDRSVVIGRPYIYLAVDTATELIAGIYVGMEAGETAMLKCLANAASDKVAFCQSFGVTITAQQWPNHGMPHELVTDKGYDFCSKRVEELCIRYGVELQSLPPFRPDGKGLVEKSFDLLQQRYKPQLRGHGVIEADAQERWATDYRKQAILDIHQFTELLIHCIIYVNSGRVLSCGRTAARLWESAENDLLAVDEKELHLLTLPREKEKLTRKGFHHNGLWYAPEQTDQFHPGDSYMVAVDADDSSCIYIVEQGRYYPCPLSDGCREFQDLNVEELKSAKKIKQQQKSAAKQAQSEAGAVAAMEIQKIIDQAMVGVRHKKTIATGKEYVE